MAALVASVVFQLSVTWSPAEIRAGVAVIWAVGAGAGGGAVAAGGGGCFFLQPATATKATNRSAGATTRKRRFNVGLLPRGVRITYPFYARTNRTAQFRTSRGPMELRAWFGLPNSLCLLQAVSGDRAIQLRHGNERICLASH